jgi:hypothetical protein
MELSVVSRYGMTRLLSRFLVLGMLGTLSMSTAYAEDSAEDEETKSESVLKARKVSGSDSSDTPKAKGAPVVGGVAQTLPEKVILVGMTSNTVTGSYGFDPDGTKEDLGYDLYIRAFGYGIAYGITDRLTFQVGIPVISQDKTSMNADELRRTPTYRSLYLETTEYVANQLIASGACTDLASCQQRIDNEYLTIPVDTPFKTTTTGETINIKGGLPVKYGSDAYVVGAFRPSSGKTGPGDLRLRLNYATYSDPSQLLTFGLGFVLPTGAYNKPSAYRVPGRGFQAIAFNILYDFRILPALVISWRNESEYLANTVTRSRSSQVDPTQFNVAEPTDGNPNRFKTKRKGIKNSGGFKLSSNLSYVHHFLNPISWGYSYNYSYDPAYDNEAPSPLWGRRNTNYPTYTTSQTFNVSLDGLNMDPRLPFALGYAKTLPLDGEAISIAPTIEEVSLQLFYKF